MDMTTRLHLGMTTALQLRLSIADALVVLDASYSYSWGR
jgi:hypothetical protein